ncbi:MAG: hypothetical protein ACI8P3_004479, partial [Saprospiraceae bacterium]
MSRYRLVLFITIILTSLIATPLWSQSNEGTNFWFGFMEHRDAGQNEKIAMITSKYNTSGVISLPNQAWSQNFTVLANNVVIITLPDVTENRGSEIIDDVGVQVISEDPISLYIHQYHSYRSEATVVLPVSSLGNEYYAMGYTGINQNGVIYPSEFLIVATQDETVVTITLSDETLGGKPEGTTYSVELNAGETYQVQAKFAGGDLTGSHITANNNFAVFAGNSWTQVPSNCEARDNLLEQMFPVSTWGKQIVTVPNSKTNYDVFRILAAESSTLVTVYGSNTSNYLLNAGEYVEYQKSVATYILSDKPIQVAQFNVGSGCNGHPQGLGDPSMVLLNSVEQTRDTVTLYNSSFQNITENFINIIVATEDFPFVTFDGQPVPGSAETGMVGLADEFTYARLQVNTGAHTIIADGCGVIATAYGYGEVESYAYSGGASFKNININPIPEGGCLNDTINFDAKLSANRYSFIWDLGDGTTTTAAIFNHFYPNLGTYTVQLIILDECLQTKDTLTRELLISLRQAVVAEGDTTICEGASFSLGATDLSSADFEWNGPNGYFSNNQFPVIHNARPEMSGEYAVVGIVSGCATYPAFSEVAVIPAPTPDLGPDTVFCNTDFETILDPGAYATYLWQDESDWSSLDILESGIYWVEVSDQYGCIGTDTVELQKICPTVIYI